MAVKKRGVIMGEWLVRHGMKAVRLAEALDVSRQHISKIIKGDTNLTAKQAIRLQNATYRIDRNDYLRARDILGLRDGHIKEDSDGADAQE